MHVGSAAKHKDRPTVQGRWCTWLLLLLFGLSTFDTAAVWAKPGAAKSNGKTKAPVRSGKSTRTAAKGVSKGKSKSARKTKPVSKAEAKKAAAEAARCKQKANRNSKSCKALAKKGDGHTGHVNKAGKVKSRRGGIITTVCGRKYAVAKKKETLAKFARRVRVSADTVRALNGLGGKAKLKAGRKYLIGKSPHDGVVLRGGVHMAEQDDLWQLRDHHAWGKPLLVHSLETAIAAVDASYPLGTRVIIGDLSKNGGGCLPPHKSHRGGMDVDIGYWFRGGRQPRWLETARPHTLDADRTWLFLQALIRSGRVQYAFITYDLQEPLYDAALRHGWTESQLRPIFQYPRPVDRLAGVIRHLKGHDNHSHIRMFCPPEGECVLDDDARRIMASTRDERLGGPGTERVGPRRRSAIGQNGKGQPAWQQPPRSDLGWHK